jgi:hypothetical protein
MPKSVAMTASRSGCACTNAKLGYSTLSYVFESENMAATLSLFAKRVNRELHNEPDQSPATRMTRLHSRHKFEVPSFLRFGVCRL